jgi:hypothetical protein
MKRTFFRSILTHRGQQVMTCRQFESACNELIDAGLPIMVQPATDPDRTRAGNGAATTREPVSAGTDLQRLLLDHASGCPACRAVADRYETLRLALRAWGPQSAAPEGLADRILAAVEGAGALTPHRRAATGKTRRFSRANRPLAAVAASLIAALTFGLLIARLAIKQPRVNESLTRALQSEGVENPAADKRGSVDALALNDAVAGAADATWDLARTASEPAARISRQMLDAATGPELSVSLPNHVVDPGAVPSFRSLAHNSATAVAMLQQVGDRFATGVRPLSNTARHAFGFLLGPAAARPVVPTHTRAAKGA